MAGDGRAEQRDSKGGRDRADGGEAGQRSLEAVVEDRRVDAPGKVAQFSQGFPGVVVR